MTRVIIYPHHKDYTVLMFPVIQHLSEVCSLSCRANFEPVSAPLQNSIRFFRPPLPTYLSAHLAARFPYSNGDNWVYPVPPIIRGGLAPAYSPGESRIVWDNNGLAQPYPLPFWSRPISIFGLSSNNDVYQQFTYVAHTTISSSHPARCCQS